MNKNIERISEISTALRLAEIDIDALYAGKAPARIKSRPENHTGIWCQLDGSV